MKGCVQWNPIYGGEDYPQAGMELCLLDQYARLDPLSYKGSLCILKHTEN